MRPYISSVYSVQEEENEVLSTNGINKMPLSPRPCAPAEKYLSFRTERCWLTANTNIKRQPLKLYKCQPYLPVLPTQTHLSCGKCVRGADYYNGAKHAVPAHQWMPNTTDWHNRYSVGYPNVCLCIAPASWAVSSVRGPSVPAMQFKCRRSILHNSQLDPDPLRITPSKY